jgi:hypothetical protein
MPVDADGYREDLVIRFVTNSIFERLEKTMFRKEMVEYRTKYETSLNR